MENLIKPWLPLRDLPQLPCCIEVKGYPERVAITLDYSAYGNSRNLRIDFVLKCSDVSATLPLSQ